MCLFAGVGTLIGSLQKETKVNQLHVYLCKHLRVYVYIYIYDTHDAIVLKASKGPRPDYSFRLGPCGGHHLHVRGHSTSVAVLKRHCAQLSAMAQLSIDTFTIVCQTAKHQHAFLFDVN